MFISVRIMGGGTFFKVGGAQRHVKNTIENFCCLNWQLGRHKHWNMMSLPIHHIKVWNTLI